MPDGDKIRRLEKRIAMLESEARYDKRVHKSVEDAMQIIADKLGMALGELYEVVR
tara:strand:- start:60 stop:224 length:165 start_codon:yes stop_codon:yes gene_type:complete